MLGLLHDVKNYNRNKLKAKAKIHTTELETRSKQAARIKIRVDRGSPFNNNHDPSKIILL